MKVKLMTYIWPCVDRDRFRVRLEGPIKDKSRLFCGFIRMPIGLRWRFGINLVIHTGKGMMYLCFSSLLTELETSSPLLAMDEGFPYRLYRKNSRG